MKMVTEPVDDENKKLIIFNHHYSYQPGKEPQTVFKLHGDLTHRQYVCINESFFQTLPRLEAKNLLHMCQIGRVLGNSRGEKGFLLFGNKTIKAKDCSKDPRYHGELLTTVEHKNKPRHLFEITARITHKNK